MPIDGVGGAMNGAAMGATGVSAATTGSADKALGQLGGDTFLKLLVAQLRYQNPMQPTDGTAMLQQTAQFTQVETLKRLADTQQQLLGFQQTSMASSMVGKQVTAIDELGEQVTGMIDHIRFTADGPVLCMGEREFPLSAAQEIRLSGAEGATSASASA